MKKLTLISLMLGIIVLLSVGMVNADVLMSDSFGGNGDDVPGWEEDEPYSGGVELDPNHMDIEDDSVAYRSVSTVGYENIVLSYDRKTSGLEGRPEVGPGDELRVGWKTGSYSGNWNDWNELEWTRDRSWTSKQFDLGPGAEDTTILIAFFLDNGDNDQGQVDNVEVTGDEIPYCDLIIQEPFNGTYENGYQYYDSEAVYFEWILDGNSCTPIDEFDLWYEKDGDCEFDAGSWMTLESDIAPGLVENPDYPDYAYWWNRPMESGLYCVKVKVSSNGARDVSEHFAVDLAPPVVSLSVGDPKVGECLEEETGDCYVNQNTEIELDCHDENPDEPWQSGVDYIEYRYQVNGGEWTEWELYEEPFTFPEDSNHVLEYRCYDNVGKVDSESKDFIVDTQAPEFVQKTVGEPKLPCGDVVEGCDWYVTQDTEICFEYMDPQPHPVGGVEVWCMYDWFYDIPLQQLDTVAFDSLEFMPDMPIAFPLDEFGCFNYSEDSYHELHCWAVDALGNHDCEEDQYEIDIVDTQAPETNIWFDGPQWWHPEGNGFPFWIDGVTEVVIQGEDPEPHPVNDVTVYYRYERIHDDYCWGYQSWNITPIDDPSWMPYEGRFTMEESCHIVEGYSVDALGNVGEVEARLVFVDKTAPTLEKEVGKPSHDCNGPFGFLQNCEDHWDYIVTKQTPITLSCIDEGDHPSGTEKLCYRILWDGEEIVPSLECEGQVEGDYCCAYTDEVTITFGEECEHQLDFYCVDHVNKTSEIDSEIFKVEGRPFTLELEKKWNLISVPFNLLSSNVEEVFSELDEEEGELEIIWSYEDGEWKFYIPEEETSTLEDIVPGRGYWVKMSDENSLLMGGEFFNEGPVLPPSIPLDEGWNLIGHYGPHPKQVYCSLFSLVDTQEGHPRWSALYGYNPDNQRFQRMGNFDDTRPGKGYWIEMDVEDNYNPATACWMPMKPMPCVGPMCQDLV